jgi:hypothetical protein
MNTGTGKRSRASLKAFLAQDDGADVGVSDTRAAELRSLDIEDAAALEAIREVFAGTSLPDDQQLVVGFGRS